MAERLLNALKKGDKTAFFLSVLVQYFYENCFHVLRYASVSGRSRSGVPVWQRKKEPPENNSAARGFVLNAQ